MLSNQNIQIAKDLAQEPVTIHVSNIKKVPHPMAPDVPTLPKESDKKKKVAKQAQRETQDTDLNGDSQDNLADMSVPDMEIPPTSISPPPAGPRARGRPPTRSLVVSSAPPC